MEDLVNESRRRVISNGETSAKMHFELQRAFKPFFVGGDVYCIRERFLCVAGPSLNIVSQADGSILDTFEMDGENITSICPHPTRDECVVSTNAGQSALYDFANKHVIRRWRPHADPVFCSSFDRSGVFLATVSSDKVIKVWDMRQGYLTHVFKGHTGMITKLVFHPFLGVPVLLSASEDCSVRVWNLSTFSCSHVVSNHAGVISDVEIVGADGLFACASRDRTISFHDGRTSFFLGILPVYTEVESMLCLHAEELPGSHLVASMLIGTNVGEIKLVDVVLQGGKATSATLSSIKLSDFPISSLMMLDSKIFSGATSDGNIFIVSKDQQNLALQSVFVGSNDEVTDLKFVDSNRLLIGTNGVELRLLNVVDGAYRFLRGHNDAILSVAVFFVSFPDKSRVPVVATGSKDETVCIWDAESGECAWRGLGHTGPVSAVCAAAEEVFCSTNRTASAWWKSPHVKFSIVSTSEDGTIKGWAAVGGGSVEMQCTMTVVGHQKAINGVAVSRSRDLMATCSQDKTVKLWKLSQGGLDLMFSCKGHRKGVWSVVFSPVDKVVLSGSGDATCRLWSCTDGSCIRVLQFSSPLLKAVFSRTGEKVFASSATSTFGAWDAKTGELLHESDSSAHHGKLWSIAVSPDGAVLATGGNDSNICFWKDVTESVLMKSLETKTTSIRSSQEFEDAIRAREFGKALKKLLELDLGSEALFSLLLQWTRDCDLMSIQSELSAVLRESFSAFPSSVQSLLASVKSLIVYPRSADIASFVLSAVLLVTSEDELVKVEGISELVEVFAVYSKRHYDKYDRFLTSSFMIPFAFRQADRLFTDAQEAHE
eukprot:ANDGO_06754.mRNA.1 putative U3 small nucleolar RNA-associated protein 13